MNSRMNATLNRNLRSLHDFRRSARRMKPTKAHRPALWECMLGTVYAANAKREVKYCDYRYEEAVAHIGPHRDVRVHRIPRGGGYYDLSGAQIPAGQLVWFVIYE